MRRLAARSTEPIIDPDLPSSMRIITSGCTPGSRGRDDPG